MVMDISFENSANERTYFIFSAVDICPTPGRHFCICHALDYVEGKGSLNRHHREKNVLHPLYLYEAKGEQSYKLI